MYTVLGSSTSGNELLGNQSVQGGLETDDGQVGGQSSVSIVQQNPTVTAE